mmetsp:Transcript_18389/g.45932  ORF Transcript_18389/g.45932 Transcript_18389/m.45932 type:complete len:363 (+) Transcript_18389:141-1229(+)
MTSPIIGVSQYGGSPSLLNAPPLVGGPHPKHFSPGPPLNPPASHKNSPDYHKRGNSYCAYENYPSPSSASRGARAPASPVGRKWSYDKLMAIFEKFDRPERTGVLETENDQTDALEAGCRYLLQRLLVTSIAPRGGSSSSPEERREQEAEAGEAILRATEQFQRILRQSPVLQDILLRRRYGGGLPLALFFRADADRRVQFGTRGRGGEEEAEWSQLHAHVSHGLRRRSAAQSPSPPAQCQRHTAGRLWVPVWHPLPPAHQQPCQRSQKRRIIKHPQLLRGQLPHRQALRQAPARGGGKIETDRRERVAARHGAGAAQFAAAPRDRGGRKEAVRLRDRLRGRRRRNPGSRRAAQRGVADEPE